MAASSASSGPSVSSASSGPSASSTTPVSSASSASFTPSPPVTFANDIVTEHRGDVAKIGVLFRDAETATVRVGSGADHVATVVVRDADGDGSATVRLNTYDGTIAASEGDVATVRERSSVETPLAAETYDLDLWIGDGTDGEQWAVGNLVLEERSTDGLRTLVAPQSADLSNPNAIDVARATGNLTRSSVVARNDTLVLQLRASGLEGVVAAQNGSNATDRFDSWLDGDGVSLDVIQTTPSPERAPLYLNVTDPRATTVIHDAQNHSYYLVVDTERVPVTDRYPGTDEDDVRTSEYRANVTLTDESGLVESRTSVEANFTVRDREAAVVTASGSDRVHVASAPNRSVPVKTALAPGSKVTVAVEGSGDQFPFEATGRVRNTSDGFVFAPEFDFSDVQPGTEFTVTVSHRGESIMGYGGPDGGIVTEPTASVTWNTVSEQDASVTASLSQGGFVVVRRGSVDGDLLGNSAHLEPGAEQTVPVPFDQDLDSNATLVAVAFRDSDGDGQFDPETDEPYVTGNYDHRVATSTEVAFGEASETADRGTTHETTESSLQEGTTSNLVTEPTSATDPAVPGIGSPGFGVGATLVALLVVAFLARRR